uniref:Tetraspanin n=1 Tax=Knipowitschia caucasica TaxID=637954 RepID=A0AAV2L7Q4_KNICA
MCINPTLTLMHKAKIRMMENQAEKNSRGTICLKYILVLFNVVFLVSGGVLLAVGVWALVEKSDLISLLDSSFFFTLAFAFIAAGAIVIVTGTIGCCASLKEIKSLLVVFVVLLLCIFLLEIIAGTLAFINYKESNEELQQNLKQNMQQKYQQEETVTRAVDRLQQEFRCCGSNSSEDWADSLWIQDQNNKRLVPDSCCKTPADLCGLRDHPSNIYRLEGGCVHRLEQFLLWQLQVLGTLGVAIASLQLLGMLLACCLHRNLTEDTN